MRVALVWRMGVGLVQDFISVPVLESSFGIFCVECSMFFITIPVTLSILLLVMGVLRFLPQWPRLLAWHFLMMPFFHFFYLMATCKRQRYTRRDNNTRI